MKEKDLVTGYAEFRLEDLRKVDLLSGLEAYAKAAETIGKINRTVRQYKLGMLTVDEAMKALCAAEEPELRSEDPTRYDPNGDTITSTITATRSTMISDARIKLAGQEQPSVRITNRAELEAFCEKLIGDSAVEEFHIISVNIRCEVISESMISTGDLSSCDAPLAKIAKVALLSNAYGVFLTHNHPSGTCAPSKEDISSTIAIQQGLEQFGIKLFDHIIVTQNNGCYSMVCHGDITN